MDPLLDVQRRHVNHEIRPVLLVFPSPHELRVQIAVAPLVGHSNGLLLLLSHQRLVLGGRQVPAPCLLMREGFDGL